MAKIEMDISEYEAMKENKKLLEDALSREKELSGTIDKLNQEKIEIMEQNEKSVTIIEEKRVTEIMYAKISSKHAMQLICEIADNVRGRGINSTSFYHSLNPDSIFDYLIETLFNRTEGNDCPPQEKRVVYKGLDEVTQQIEDELKAEIDLDVQKKLEAYKSLCVAYNEISDNYKSSRTQNGITKKANAKLNEENKELTDKIKKSTEDVAKYQSQVRNIFNILKDIEKEVIGMHIFNKPTKMNNISELIKKWTNGSNT